MEESMDHDDRISGNRTGYDLETDVNMDASFINFISTPPTLQSIAAVPIAVRLWSEPDVIEEFRQGYVNYSHFVDKTRYEELETRVIDKLASSSLPSSYKSKIYDFIRPIGIQLVRWFESDDTLLPVQEYCSLKDLRQTGGSIYWTMNGTIDKVKVLEEHINSKNPDKNYYYLYKLACKYCLEKHIFELWKKLPCEKMYMLEYMYKHVKEDDVIVAYWTFTLQNEWHIMLTLIETNVFFLDNKPDFNILQNMICWSISVGNSFAFNYFWQKLTREEKSDSNILFWLGQLAKQINLNLGRYADLESVSYPYILCVLLSHLKSQGKQKSFFKRHSEVFLQALLRCWPHQRFFKPAFLALVKFDYISEDTYLTRMFDLAEKIVKEKSADFFREVWSVSPRNLKQRFLTDNLEPNYHVRLLFYLLEIVDLKTAFMVLKDASAEDKRELVSVVTTCKYLQKYVSSKNDLALLDALLKEMLPPDKSLPSIKQELMHLQYDWYGRMCLMWICEGDLLTVDAFLKWAFQSVNELEKFKKEKLPFIQTYISLIGHGNYEHVNRFVNWYFGTEGEIREVKNIFFHKDNDFYLEKLLHEFGRQKEKSSDLFQKFVCHSLCSTEEVSEFKKMCLSRIKDIVRADHFEFATVVLNWCCDGTDEVDRYKTEIVISHSGLKTRPPYDYSMLNKMVRNLVASKDLMKWALPLSKEVVAALKLSLSRDEDFHGVSLKSIFRKRDTLFRLIDCKSIAEVEAISRKCRR